MAKTLGMDVGQRVRDLSCEPHYAFQITSSVEQPTGRSRAVGHFWVLGRVQDCGGPCGATTASKSSLDDVSQGRPAEIGHADALESRALVLEYGMHGNDVGVVQPAQGVGFGDIALEQLDHHLPAAQRAILRSVHAGKRALSQLVFEEEAADHCAR